MLNRSTKGLKPFIIKYVAMLMGICYLINPLQEQIHILLHEITHALESPTQIISHESNLNFEHKSLNHFDPSANDIKHEHGIVDLINLVLDSSSEKNNPKESLLKEVIIDKHITINQFQLQKRFKIDIVSTFRMFKEKSKCGYFEKKIKPPQNLIG